MKKFILTLCLVLFVFTSREVRGQNNVDTITVNGGTVVLNVSSSSNTIHLTLTGTWTATLAFEYLPFNSTTYAALTCTNETSFATATGATANGNFACLNINFTSVRVRASAFSSGTATVSWRATSNGSLTGLIFGGGSGGTIGTVNQGTASATEQWLVNCVTGCSGSTTDTDDNNVAFAQVGALQIGLGYMSNGTNWVRQIGDATNGQKVQLTTAIPTGANTIGAVSQNGTWTVQPGNTANTTAWLVTGTGGTFPITDSGGSITVDNGGTFAVQAAQSGTWNIGTVATLTNALPAGTNAIGKLAANSGVDIGDVDVTSVGGNVTVVQGTGTNLHMVCDSGCTSSSLPADNSAFTAGTTGSSPISGFYQATPTALTDGRIGAVGLSATRAMRTTIESAAGVAWTPSTDYTHDTALGTITNVTGPENMFRASAAVPTDVSADGDAVLGWALRSGAQAIQPTYAGVLGVAGNGASGTGVQRVTVANDSTGKLNIWDGTDTLAIDGSGNALVTCSNCSGSGASAVDNSAFTGGTSTVAPAGFLFDATIPTITDGSVGLAVMDSARRVITVGAGIAGTAAGGVLTIQGVASMTKLLVTPDSVALPANQSVNVSQINGVTTLMGNGVTGTGSQRVTIASDNTAFTVNLGTAGSDPFGANADAASATGSISAKLRFIASTGIPITGTVTVGSHAVTNAGTFVVQENGTDTGCYLVSAASTNSTSCKGSAGFVRGIRFVNTTATLYYLRLYNSAGAPTCSSATGFIESIPVPASTTGAGVVWYSPKGISYATGIGFCFTGGSSSTDNTNAATGVFGAILYN